MSKILNDLSLSEEERINLHVKGVCEDIDSRIKELESDSRKIKIKLQANELVAEAYRHALNQLREAVNVPENK
jgi:predicted DNA-binding antitoxin AbrB/MazE fold protein